MSKIIKIIAGLNGSGKSTFAEACLEKSDCFLNPDLIALGLGSNFEKASFQAGKILLNDIKNKIKNDESFSFESTLSGVTYLSIIETAKKKGYKIVIYFLMVKNISINLQRINERVQFGGHDIPEITVKRREEKCLDNFWNKYRFLADEWFIIDNTSTTPTEVMNFQIFHNLSPLEQEKFEKDYFKKKS